MKMKKRKKRKKKVYSFPIIRTASQFDDSLPLMENFGA